MGRRRSWLAAAAWMLSIPSLAVAQVNLEGYWRPLVHEDGHERGEGPLPGTYEGLPINDAARFHADSFDAAIISLPEHQCIPHSAAYGPRGPGQMRIREERDPRTQELIALHSQMGWMEERRTIWMDGREHPPEYAPHTWQGFSTGTWDGDDLVVRTTHQKAGYLRRNGIYFTDHVKLLERFIRHGDLLIIVTHVEDPHRLTEPMMFSTTLRWFPNGNVDPYPCRPVVEIPRERGDVPSLLPDENRFSEEAAKQRGMPLEAVRGGAATMYPEFMYSGAGRQDR